MNQLCAAALGTVFLALCCARSATPAKEVRLVRRGVHLTIIHGDDDQICKIEVPSGSATSQEVDKILGEMVPLSVRGEKWSEIETMIGAGGFATKYYEHVIITEQIFGSDVLDKRPSASVLFKEKTCGWKAGREPFDRPSPTERLRIDTK